MEITRTTLIDAELDDVWQAIIDDDARSAWLDDERSALVLAVDPGRRVTWCWDRDDQHHVTTTVTIELERTGDGLTQVTVTERAAAPSCSLPATLDVELWDRRLLGLELRCLTRSGSLTPALV